jgi:hypothetical protein
MVNWVMFVVITAVEGAPRESEPYQRILGGHRRDREHAHKNRHRTLGVGERAELDCKSQAARQKGSVEDQQTSPRRIRRLRNGHACQRHHAQHDDEHWDRQDRTDLAETASDIVGGNYHQVAGDMGGEQPTKR